MHRNHCWQCSGKHMWCWELNQGQLGARFNSYTTSPAPGPHFYFTYLLLFGGHTQWPSGVTLDSALRNYSWRCSGDHMECRGSNPGQQHARQMPYPLCYHSSCSQGSFQVVLGGGYLGCWRLNQGRARIRQVPFLLYYLSVSGPIFLSLFLESSGDRS